jgi:hypothetical protein
MRLSRLPRSEGRPIAGWPFVGNPEHPGFRSLPGLSLNVSVSPPWGQGVAVSAAFCRLLADQFDQRQWFSDPAEDTSMKSPVTIRFISGREERFEVEFPGGAGTETRFKQFLGAPTVALQTAGELHIIPSTGIESISISLPKDVKQQIDIGNVLHAKRLT